MSNLIAFPVDQRFTPAERRLIETVRRLLPDFTIERVRDLEGGDPVDRAFYGVLRRAFPPSENLEPDLRP